MKLVFHMLILPDRNSTLSDNFVIMNIMNSFGNLLNVDYVVGMLDLCQSCRDACNSPYCICIHELIYVLCHMHRCKELESGFSFCSVSSIILILSIYLT